MKNLRTAIIASIAAFAVAGPASAGVVTYDTVIGNGIGAATLVIDGDAGTARYTGANVDLTLSGDAFKGFDGIDGTTRLMADDIVGTFTRNGTTYDAFASTQPKHTKLSLTSSTNFLWTFGRDSDGNLFDFDGKGELSLVSTCQTNCGGNTSGGSSSGGGQVPVPAPLTLIGAMALFAAWRRKRLAAA